MVGGGYGINMDLHLQNRVVLVTGSSRGIGKGIAEVFLQEGARVVLTGRNETDLYETASGFSKQFGKKLIFCFPGDLNQKPVLEKLKAFIQRKVNALNHLVCNIGSGRSVPPLEEDRGEFQRMLDINLLGAVEVVRQMMPLLEESATQGNAATSITFVGSICGVEVLGCPVAYASSKSALEAYAKNIARPMGRKGIRVNIVSPGNIIFPDSIWDKKLKEDRAAVEAMLDQNVPLNRLGTVDDIGNVVAFLASKRADFVSGANWIVDGGQTH